MLDSSLTLFFYIDDMVTILDATWLQIESSLRNTYIIVAIHIYLPWGIHDIPKFNS